MNFSSSSVRSKFLRIYLIKRGEDFKGHKEWINDVLYFRSVKRLVSCSYDNSIRIFDSENGEESQRRKNHHRNIVYCLCKLSALEFVSGGQGGRLMLWKFREGEFQFEGMFIHECSIHCMMRIGKNEIVCGDFKGFLNFCSIRPFKILKRLEDGSEFISSFWRLKLYKNLFLCVGGSLSTNFNLRLYDYEMKKKVNDSLNKDLEGHSNTIFCVSSFVVNSEKSEKLEKKEVIVTGGQDRKLIFWDLQKIDDELKCVKSSIFMNEFEIRSVLHLKRHVKTSNVFYDCYNFVFFGDEKGFLNFFNYEKFERIKREKIHSSCVRRMKYLDQRKNLFVTCSWDKLLRMYVVKFDDKFVKNVARIMRKKTSNSPIRREGYDQLYREYRNLKQQNVNAVYQIAKLRHNEKDYEMLIKLLHQKANSVSREREVIEKSCERKMKVLKDRINNLISELPSKEYSRITSYVERREKRVLESKNPDLSFKKNNFLDFHQKISNFCFKDFLKLEDKEVALLVDKERDNILEKFLSKVLPENKKVWKKLTLRMGVSEKERIVLERAKKFVKSVVREVSKFFGGEIHSNVFEFQNKVDKKMKEVLKSRNKFDDEKTEIQNLVYLGEMKGLGGVRERCILFKLLCDSMNIDCRLFRDMRQNILLWNSIRIGNKEYVVCLNSEVSLCTYGEGGEEMLFESLGNKNQSDSRMLELVMKSYQTDKEVLGEGSGSFGKVYKLNRDKVKGISRDEFVLPKVLAIKEINLEMLDRKNVSHTKNEFREMIYSHRELKDNNILNIIGIQEKRIDSTRTYGEKDDYLFIVMKYYNCNGWNFKDFIFNENGKDCNLSKKEKLGEILIVLLEISSGLQYLHKLGKSHLNLNPGNVLIQWKKDEKRVKEVKLTDFGMLPLISTQYSSPEIKKLEDMKNIQTDIYSFGMIMTDFDELYSNNRELKRIEAKCLSKNPVDRPSLNEISYVLELELKTLNIM